MKKIDALCWLLKRKVWGAEVLVKFQNFQGFQGLITL